MLCYVFLNNQVLRDQLGLWDTRDPWDPWEIIGTGGIGTKKNFFGSDGMGRKKNYRDGRDWD